MSKTPEKKASPKQQPQKNISESDVHSLRAAAENQLDATPQIENSISSLQDIVHELKVHQIELEMQNAELKRAQSILEESRERYVDFYDFAPVGYITLGSDSRIEEINLTGAALLAVERNNLIRKNFINHIAPEDRTRWNRQYTDILLHDKKFTCELSILRTDGSRLHVQLDSLRLLKDDRLTVVRMAMTDITERILAEEAIREQEEFFRMITENIEDFIAVTGLDGKRIYNSPSYARLFKNFNQASGTDSFSEIHPDDRERVKKVFMETVRTGIGLKIEYRFMLADNSVRHMESQGVLIRNRQGKPSRVVVISRDITERKLIDEKIRNLAYFDALTQLPNRRMLDDRMNQAMAASKRSAHYCALMFLDLDNFKPLNDRYGHGAGDMLLIEVAHRIGNCVREMDTVARFGGDEFVVILTELDTGLQSSITQSRIAVEKILAVIAKPYRLTVKGRNNSEIHVEHHCTASIGVAMFIDHENSPDELLKIADKAMYQAKNDGRNRACFADINTRK